MLIGAVVLVGVYEVVHTGVRWQASESAPKGLYRIVEVAEPLVPGAWVLVCADGPWAHWMRDRGYLTPGDCPSGTIPLLKQVLAVAGDRVVSTRVGEVWVNGRLVVSEPLSPIDREGRAMPRPLEGIFVLGEGEIWLGGIHPARSLDSRLFGPAAASRVVGGAEPILWF